MENNSNNFSSFCSEVLSETPYDFSDSLLREFYDEGYTVHETVSWAEDQMDEDLFGDDLLGDL